MITSNIVVFCINLIAHPHIQKYINHTIYVYSLVSSSRYYRAYRQVMTITNASICCRGYTGEPPLCQGDIFCYYPGCELIGVVFVFSCIAVCSRSCLNGGTCHSPEQCECSPGWTGASCSQGETKHCII